MLARPRKAIRAALAGLIVLSAPAAQATDAPPPLPQVAAPMMPLPLPILVELATGWVAADLGVPIPETLPRVAFADEVTMQVIRASAADERTAAVTPDRAVVAMYDARSGTVFLPLGWTGQTRAEMSMLVHEIVHNFQFLAGERFACPAAREKKAYEVQERWLAGQGESLESALGIDPMFLLIATNCMF